MIFLVGMQCGKRVSTGSTCIIDTPRTVMLELGGGNVENNSTGKSGNALNSKLNTTSN